MIVLRLMTRLQDGRPTNRLTLGRGFLFSPICPDQFQGPPSLLLNLFRGIFPENKALEA